MKKVAILGATGYIGKSLAYEMSHSEKYELFLFSRDKHKALELEHVIQAHGYKNNITYCGLDEFTTYTYDLIINSIGMSNLTSLKENGEVILTITRTVDEMILEYLQTHKDTFYINMSSGAVYKKIDKAVTPSDYYALAKQESEIRHRERADLSIVDIRVFSFFSSFVNTEDHFLLSEIVKCLQEGKILETNNDDIVRDYVTPQDLLLLIENIIKKKGINDFFDAYSKNFITKFRLLDQLKKMHGLQYVIKDASDNQAQGLSSSRYYSEDKKAEHVLGYVPRFSSLTGIEYELKKYYKCRDAKNNLS